MEIIRIEVMPLGTNCYLAYDESTREGIVIDPGGSPELIKKAIDNHGVRVVAIVNTHGHWDHVGANDEIKAYTGAPVYIGTGDKDFLTDSSLNSSAMMGARGTVSDADGLLNEGDIISFGSCRLKVLETPGHSPGGISLAGEGAVFSGDTLFYRSVGRSDLYGGSYDTLIASVRYKLFTLPDDTLVCTGHGIPTNIGEEKQGNPFAR